MNNRDHDQKYYLSYEDGETHFWVNDDVKSQLSFPIGGIVAFPVGANPSRNSDNWLECNGQSFDTSKYPELYKILGSNKVPNYQGMFLRGYGSQSFSQNNGDLNETGNRTTYKSGNIGAIQGDGMRRLYGGGGPFQFRTPGGISNGIYGNFMKSTMSEYGAVGSLARKYSLGFGSAGGILPQADIPYMKYDISCSGGGEGESVSCSLSSSIDYFHDILTEKECVGATCDLEYQASRWVGWDSNYAAPEANEIRPVNIAVKYWIRSR